MNIRPETIRSPARALSVWGSSLENRLMVSSFRHRPGSDRSPY
jgi:hypothetical protein